MSLMNYLSLITVLLFLVSAGLLNNSSFKHQDWCATKKVHPALCAKKMHLKDATVGDLAIVDGISLKKSRLLIAAIKQEPETSFADLLAIKGIGPKTIAKLALSFSAH